MSFILFVSLFLHGIHDRKYVGTYDNFITENLDLKLILLQIIPVSIHVTHLFTAEELAQKAYF